MSRRGWLLFGAMSVIWGIPYLLIKVAVGGLPVPDLVLSRVGIGAALLLPLALRRGQLAVLRPHWRWLAVFALVEIIVPWLLLSEAETRLTSSLSGLLLASVPTLVAVLSLLTGGGDRVTPLRWGGLLTGLAGVALLAGRSISGGDALSVAEVLMVALCYSIGPLVASRKLSELPPLGLTAACLAFAAVVYAPLAAFSWPGSLPSPSVLAAVAGLAVVCTAAAFLLFFALIAEVGPARASVITYVNPAVAVALGVLVLGESLTPLMLGSFALILGGSVLAAGHGTRQVRAAGRQALAEQPRADRGDSAAEVSSPSASPRCAPGEA